jgi:hypothetical protein
VREYRLPLQPAKSTIMVTIRLNPWIAEEEAMVIACGIQSFAPIAIHVGVGDPICPSLVGKDKWIGLRIQMCPERSRRIRRSSLNRNVDHIKRESR